MLMASSITQNKERDGIRFTITSHDPDFGEAVSDVMLTEVPEHAVDMSWQSKTPPGSKVYDIASNNPEYSGQAAWDPAGKTLRIRTSSDATLKEFRGSLKQCILKAYNEGALGSS